MNNQFLRPTVLDQVNELMNKRTSLSSLKLNSTLIIDLSKLSWKLTIAVISTTWIVQNLDNVVSKHEHYWLEFPISATFFTLILQKSKYRINNVLP